MASISMLLYYVSAQIKPLLSNAIGQSVMLSGASSFGNHILLPTCRRCALRLTPNVSISRYSCSLTL